MVIDCHVHLTAPTLLSHYDRIAAEEPYFKLLSESSVNRFATAEDALRYMDANQIDQAVVFGFAFQNQKYLDAANEYIIEAVQKHPDRFIGFGVVNPNLPNLADKIRSLAENGMIGIGELFPTGQNFALGDYTAMKPLADACMEHNLVLSIHANEPVGHDYPGKTATGLLELQQFAEHFPELAIIYCHFGGGLAFYEMMPEMQKILQNVRYDTAAAKYLYTKQIYPAFKSMQRIDKLLFGSDYPLPCAPAVLADIRASEISPADKDKVLGQNLIHLLSKRGQA